MKSFSYSVMYGTLVIFGFALVCSLIFSFILRFSSIEETSIQLPITIISFAALFSGGFISGKLAKQKGWLTGGLTGLIYSVTMILYQYLGYHSSFHWEQIVYHSCFLITAMMGGILGVNLSSDKRS
ncbi:TIGR04086 family membrane protein [Bacillus xiapuensis]|uniref:TIGR04086 family membrane protein n=1 Tax=Bacillus xiapuensis TaxID=2014075 RepID=UPI001E5F53E0|nr:TIGR04086 family membrane protein [Bacillus xiapuensis]